MPDYSRRHYNQFASILNYRMTELNSIYDELNRNELDNSPERDALGKMQAEGRLQLISIYRDVVRMFEADNPRFNSERFAKACGDEYKNNKIAVGSIHPDLGGI
jgi:hypothetical protein